VELTQPYYWAPGTPSSDLTAHQHIAKDWQLALRNVMLDAMNLIDDQESPIPASNFRVNVAELHPDSLSVEEATLWWYPPTLGLTGPDAIQRVRLLKATFDDLYLDQADLLSRGHGRGCPRFDLEIEPKDWTGGTYGPKGHCRRSWGPKSD